MNRYRRSRWPRLGVGLAAVTVLIALPTPPTTAHSQTPASTSGSAAPALASVWPDYQPFTLPATLPDGSTYTPVLILGPTTSVGQTTSLDAASSSLVLAAAGQPVRVLQTHLVNNGGSYDGITATADRLFWIHTVGDADGHSTSTLWSAARPSGRVSILTTDVGEPLFYGSQYDVQVVNRRLYWITAHGDQPDKTELRSMSMAGGPVDVRVLDGTWEMSSWPWLVTAPTAVGPAATELFNADTGATVTVNAPPNSQVICRPTWCRLIISGKAGATETDLIRPDGSDRRRVGDADATPIASDVALLDRFEVVMTTISSNVNVTVSRLDLYDITHSRSVLIEAAATDAYARGNFVWWSTGDNETLAWHGLDLHALP